MDVSESVTLDIESLNLSPNMSSGSPQITKVLSRKGSSRPERRNEEQEGEDSSKKLVVKARGRNGLEAIYSLWEMGSPGSGRLGGRPIRATEEAGRPGGHLCPYLGGQEVSLSGQSEGRGGLGPPASRSKEGRRPNRGGQEAVKSRRPRGKGVLKAACLQGKGRAMRDQVEQLKQPFAPNKATSPTSAGVNSTSHSDAGEGKIKRLNRLTTVNPKRILLLFASMSSVGTMILIYFTVAIYRREGEKTEEDILNRLLDSLAGFDFVVLVLCFDYA
ncbi:hypothetical protein KSP40_PGU005046 [Platanthera guangdongensis]|uniref:Uncharacterized protein n=1 Tax=Platanthera guangdongensis TaxID=2320717 RepID=A0ABR2M044_9ASPA